MTNTEIIKGLKAVRTIHNGNYAPFIDAAIKILEQAPCEKEPCEELDFVQPHKKISVNLEVCKMRDGMTEEEPKTGHWLENGSLTCSNCGCIVYPFDIDNGNYNYCPECGSHNE